MWQVAYYLQCGTSLTSVGVCHAPFCDPKGCFKSSVLLEAVKFLKHKFLNPMVARNQPHRIFLQFVFAAVLWFYLSFVWGPHGGTFACSQLCILNHFSQCCCREPRGMCLGYTKACGLPCSMWEFTKADILKREKTSLLQQGMQKHFLPEDKSAVVSVLVGINN